MAFKKTTLDKIAGLLKLKPEDVTAAAANKDEVDLEIPEGLTVLTAEEVTTLKTNEYKSGKTNGVEMAVKESRDKLGLTFAGKTMDGLIDAVKAHAIAEAKINPDERVKTLQTDLEKVRATATDFENKHKAAEGQLQVLQLNTEIAAFIPAGAILPANKIIGLMAMDGFTFKKEEGKVVAYKDGTALKDKLSEILPVKDVITGYVTENKFIGAEDDTTGAAAGGRGKPGGPGGPTGGKLNKLSELRAQFAKDGKSELSKEFMDKAQELKTADPNFDLNA
jgi:hypothetical protein